MVSQTMANVERVTSPIRGCLCFHKKMRKECIGRCFVVRDYIQQLSGNRECLYFSSSLAVVLPVVSI